MAADPTQIGRIFFGGVGFYLSNDSGATWQSLIDSGGTHADQHAIALDPPGLQLLGNDGGLYKFTNAGGFTGLNSDISAAQIQGIGPHPSDENKLLAGFQDNGTEL